MPLISEVVLLRPMYCPSSSPNTTPAASSSGKRTVYFEFLYICVSYAGRRPDYFCGFSLFLNVYVRPTLSSVRVCTSRFCARL